MACDMASASAFGDMVSRCPSAGPSATSSGRSSSLASPSDWPAGAPSGIIGGGVITSPVSSDVEYLQSVVPANPEEGNNEGD